MFLYIKQIIMNSDKMIQLKASTLQIKNSFLIKIILLQDQLIYQIYWCALIISIIYCYMALN